MKKIAFILALLLASNVASAITEQGKEIDTLGVQGSNIYFSVKGGFSNNCKWGNIYLSNETDFGKTAYSQLLMAKASGKQLSRIDYDQLADSGCILSLIEVK